MNPQHDPRQEWARQEAYRQQQAQINVWRSKGGLEPPIVGRLYRERLLIFAPPLWYDILVIACMVLGFGSAIGAITGHLPGPATSFLGDDYWKVFGTLVGLAGAWAALSNERMSVDIRNNTYARLEGQGLFKRITRGSTQELQALVLLTAVTGFGTATYRLVLYWKGGKLPIFIASQQTVPYSPGRPVNYGAGPINQMGISFARWMSIPYQDSSGAPVPGPLRVF